MEEKLKKKIKVLKGVVVVFSILIALEVFIGAYYLIFDIFDKCDGYSIEDQKIQTINNKFIPYTGEKVSGDNVKTLVEKIINYNLTEAEDSSQFIAVQVGDASNVNTNGATSDDAQAFNVAIKTIKSEIKLEKSYRVTYGQDRPSGLILAIGIEEI